MALIIAVWQGTGAATTLQLAEFYEVPLKTVQTASRAHLEEFRSDGLVVLRGKELKDATLIFKVATRTTQLTIWTPRAAWRLGMIKA